MMKSEFDYHMNLIKPFLKIDKSMEKYIFIATKISDKNIIFDNSSLEMFFKNIFNTLFLRIHCRLKF